MMLERHLTAAAAGLFREWKQLIPTAELLPAVKYWYSHVYGDKISVKLSQ